MIIISGFAKGGTHRRSLVSERLTVGCCKPVISF